MTSANVTEYSIYKDDKPVGHHRQNWLCKTRFDELLKFQPHSAHTIRAYGYDEDEELWENEPVNLKDFLEKQSRYSAELKNKELT